MAINVQIYSNGNSIARTIVVDFLSEVLASSNSASFSSEQKHFFKFSTSAKTEDNKILQVRIVDNGNQLALNDVRWASNAYATSYGLNDTDPYPDIQTMVYDYVYDWVNGREANQNGSGCLARPKMKFSN